MSDGEDEFGEIETGVTSVLLGYAAKNAVKSDLSVLGNHIGGTPVWFQNTPPPSTFLKCAVCSKQTDLLVQLSCPLPDKDYDRSVYVFSCSDPNCRRKDGSVIAIRGIESNDTVRARISQEEAESAPQNQIAPVESSLFDSIASTNPFSSPITASVPQPKKKSKSRKQKVEIAGKYPCKLIEVEEEFLEPPDTEAMLKGVKIEEMSTESEAEASKSTDLKAMETNSDPAFSHFIEVVGCNPEQVLRYERGMKPLLYGLGDGVHEKLKQLQTKTLEVQLMPHLISELESPDMILDGMEWGSVFVATDADDKLPPLNEAGVGYCLEFVAVQWE